MIFTIEKHDHFWRCDDYAICDDTLREYFDIPEHVKEIWIEIHKHPSKYRVKVEVTHRHHTFFDGEYHPVTTPVEIFVMENAPFYVEVWYDA